MFNKFHIFTLCVILFFTKEIISMNQRSDAQKAADLEETIVLVGKNKDISLTRIRS